MPLGIQTHTASHLKALTSHYLELRGEGHSNTFILYFWFYEVFYFFSDIYTVFHIYFVPYPLEKKGILLHTEPNVRILSGLSAHRQRWEDLWEVYL